MVCGAPVACGVRYVNGAELPLSWMRVELGAVTVKETSCEVACVSGLAATEAATVVESKALLPGA